MQATARRNWQSPAEPQPRPPRPRDHAGIPRYRKLAITRDARMAVNHSESASDDCDARIFSENQRTTCTRCAPKRHADADFACSSCGRIRECSVQPNGGDEQSTTGKEERQNRHHALRADRIIYHGIHGCDTGAGMVGARRVARERAADARGVDRAVDTHDGSLAKAFSFTWVN